MLDTTPTTRNEEEYARLFRAEPQSVEGKPVLVTGGTTGIGRAIAMILVANGARVLIFGRHNKELNDALGDIRAVGGGEIHGIVADSSSYDDVHRVFGEVEQRFGRLDALVCNAGIAGSSVTDTDYNEWRKVIEVDLVAYLHFAQHAAAVMKRQGEGHIVFIGSMSAESRGKGSDVYVAAKSGVRGFSDSLARSLNPEGIRVTLIEPGLVGAEMTLEKVAKEEQDEQERQLKLLRAEEIAGCVHYCLTQPKRCNVAMVQIRPTVNSD